MNDMTDGAAALLQEFGAADACVARLLCDDHPPDHVAFTVVEPDLSARELTYGELGRESTRFAAALADLGVGPGDRVAVLMGRSIELVVTLLGIWRRGAVVVPLSTALGRPAKGLEYLSKAFQVQEATTGRNTSVYVVCLQIEGDALRHAGRYSELASKRWSCRPTNRQIS